VPAAPRIQDEKNPKKERLEIAWLTHGIGILASSWIQRVRYG